MTVAAVEALELSQLLGSLLASVVEAQAASARATVDFVESVGFEPGTDGERMRTVRLRYRKKDENGIPADFEVEVPLLALVNVPSHPRGTRQGEREPELPAPRDQARASTGVRDTRTGEGRPTTRQLPLCLGSSTH
jgi:hypothetical protein